MIKNHNRSQKIKFLKNVKDGKSSIQELHPVRILGCRQFEDEPDRITVYHPTEQVLTEAQFEKWKKTLSPNSHVIILLLPGKTGQCLVDRSNVVRHGEVRSQDIVIDL